METVLQHKKEIVLRAEGYSMYPYILPGDLCFFRSAREGIRPGQVGLVAGNGGVLYSHRLHRIERIGSGIRYVFRGDANGYFDVPVYRSQIVGVLRELTRNGRTIREDGAWRRLWSFVALQAPFALFPFERIARRKERRSERPAAERWEGHVIGGRGGVGGAGRSGP